MLYLDTHVVAWLYAGQTERLTPDGRAQIERERLLISPIVQLELAYLREVGRLAAEPALIVETLAESIGLALCDLPFARVVLESIRMNWTRDPFDRLIVAQAISRGAPLLSKDDGIRQHYERAVW
jgi:PIN domain nuclease of toxin-antitoxin system